MNNESQETVDKKRYNRRRRFGRAIFIIGSVMLLVSLLFSILVSAVSAFTGGSYIIATYSEYLLYPVLGGFLMVTVGLVTWLLPEGSPSDMVWIMRTGGYAGTN